MCSDVAFGRYNHPKFEISHFTLFCFVADRCGFELVGSFWDTERGGEVESVPWRPVWPLRPSKVQFCSFRILSFVSDRCRFVFVGSFWPWEPGGRVKNVPWHPVWLLRPSKVQNLRFSPLFSLRSYPAVVLLPRTLIRDATTEFAKKKRVYPNGFWA